MATKNEHQALHLNSVCFPVLWLSQGTAGIARRPEGINVCTTVALRNGFYARMLLVDASGKAFRVTGARQLRGVGPFRGYSVFLNRRVEVELIWAGEMPDIPLDQVKRRVLRVLAESEPWSEVEDPDEMRRRVADATSVRQVMRALDT